MSAKEVLGTLIVAAAWGGAIYIIGLYAAGGL